MSLMVSKQALLVPLLAPEQLLNTRGIENTV
jgi:hypothetical protein